MNRNISQADGLNNGTRLIVKSMHESFIEVVNPLGKDKNKRFFIPKMCITPSDSVSPVQIQRVQFPIRSAFAMTINKR